MTQRKCVLVGSKKMISLVTIDKLIKIIIAIYTIKGFLCSNYLKLIQILR